MAHLERFSREESQTIFPARHIDPALVHMRGHTVPSNCSMQEIDRKRKRPFQHNDLLHERFSSRVVVDDGHVKFLIQKTIMYFYLLPASSQSIRLETYLETVENSSVELDDGPVFPQTGVRPRVQSHSFSHHLGNGITV